MRARLVSGRRGHSTRTVKRIAFASAVLFSVFFLFLTITSFSGSEEHASNDNTALTAEDFINTNKNSTVSVEGAFVQHIKVFPPQDMEFPDDPKAEPAAIPLPDVIREDVFHTPFSTSVGFQAYAGLQLHSFSTTGVQMAAYERRVWEWHQNQLGILNNTRLKAREVLPKLIQGDAVPVPLSLQLFTDRYFVQQLHPGVFKNHFCIRFSDLMHIPNQPPLVIDMYNAQAARFVLRCLYYQTHTLKTAQRKFILLTSGGNETAASSFFIEELQAHPNVTLSYFLNNTLLLHWYGVNGNIEHPKFTPIPNGFLYYHRSGRSLLPYNVERRRMEESTQAKVMDLFLHGFDLAKMFPHVKRKLSLASVAPMWIETALDMFSDVTIAAPVTWLQLEDLPKRVTTVYIVLPPLERDKNLPHVPLTGKVMVFNTDESNVALSAAQNVALLPLTAAVFQRLHDHPYGDAARQLRVVVDRSVTDSGLLSPGEKDLYGHLTTAMSNWTLTVPGGEGNTLERYQAMSENVFVASPISEGFDAPRVWEALALGAIPIVQDPTAYVGLTVAVGGEKEQHYGGPLRSAALLHVYADLPVVVVKDVQEITESNLVQWREDILAKAQNGTYKLDSLFLQSWIDKIYTHSNDEVS